MSSSASHSSEGPRRSSRGSTSFFTATTALFILLWARLDELGPTARVLTRHVLVQGHLATENVVAAWYSSILLAIVAGLSVLAYLADRQRGVRGLSAGWLVVGAVFLLLSLDEIGSLHERIGMIGALSPWERPAGWIYVLAIPILAVAAFMIAFAMAHLRHARTTVALMALGTLLFLLNPVIEAVEMRLIHGAGAEPGTWQRHLHDALLVLEEGGLELFGVLCFLVSVGGYVQRTAPDGVSVRASFVRRVLTAALLAAGACLSPLLVDALP